MKREVILWSVAAALVVLAIPTAAFILTNWIWKPRAESRQPSAPAQASSRVAPTTQTAGDLPRLASVVSAIGEDFVVAREDKMLDGTVEVSSRHRLTQALLFVQHRDGGILYAHVSVTLSKQERSNLDPKQDAIMTAGQAVSERAFGKLGLMLRLAKAIDPSTDLSDFVNQQCVAFTGEERRTPRGTYGFERRGSETDDILLKLYFRSAALPLSPEHERIGK